MCIEGYYLPAVEGEGVFKYGGSDNLPPLMGGYTILPSSDRGSDKIPFQVYV